jgi:hypothetical protein
MVVPSYGVAPVDVTQQGDEASPVERVLHGDEIFLRQLVEAGAIAFSEEGFPGAIHEKYPSAPLVPYYISTVKDQSGKPLPDELVTVMGTYLIAQTFHKLLDHCDPPRAEQPIRYVTGMLPGRQALIPSFIDTHPWLRFELLPDLKRRDEIDTSQLVIMVSGVLMHLDTLKKNAKRLSDHGLTVRSCSVLFNRTGISRFDLYKHDPPIHAALDQFMVFWNLCRWGIISARTYERCVAYPTLIESYIAEQEQK